MKPTTRQKREAWAQWLRSLKPAASIAVQVLTDGETLKPGPSLDAWLRLSRWWRFDMPTPGELATLGAGGVPERSPPGWSKAWRFDGLPPWMARRGTSVDRHRQRRNAALGLHPFGEQRLENSEARCKDCTFAAVGWPGARCDFISARFASLAHWPACEDFEARPENLRAVAYVDDSIDALRYLIEGIALLRREQ